VVLVRRAGPLSPAARSFRDLALEHADVHPASVSIDADPV
jgi:hypothetical protein